MKNVLALSLCLTLTAGPAMAAAPAPASATSAPVAQPVQAPAALTSTTQAPIITDDQFPNFIHVEKTPVALNSKLKKKYMAYKIVVTSDYPARVSLTSGTIVNGFPGTAAAQMVETSKANAFWGALAGLAGLIIISPIVLLCINNGNKHAEEEGMAYSNQIPLTELGKGDTMTFNALIPVGQNPQLKFTFKDSKSDQTFLVDKM